MAPHFSLPQTPALILIVDDNPTNLAVLTEALGEAGYDVAVATNGEGAIAQLAYDTPDLILLDVMMPPGINGFETCRRIKDNPATQEIPILFMTALVDTEHKVKGLSLGAVDYITKPFQQEEVLARVKVHVEMQRLSQTLAAQNQELLTLSQGLQTTVAQKTQELQQAHLQLIQREKLSLLGGLMAGVAHEINNPLGCITGNVNPAREYVESLLTALALYQHHLPQPPPDLATALANLDLEFVCEDLPKVLDAMEMGGHRLRELSHALRHFTRSDVSTRVAVDIHQGIESTLVILRHRLKAQSDRPAITILKQYDKLPLIPCYPGPLNQVFMNLLANAIDAIDESPYLAEPSITITTERVGNQRVAITIENSGPTIDPALVEHLFDPQFTTKPIGKGTGLGLAISRQIVVDTHGGQLSCNPATERGVAFCLELPVEVTATAPVPSAIEAA